MDTLNNFPKIATFLKTSNKNQIQILHRLIFGSEGDRLNRSRLQKFSRFPSDFQFEETKQKVVTEFSLKDFIAICNLQHLECSTDLDKCCDTIRKHLSDLSLLTTEASDFSETGDLEESELKLTDSQRNVSDKLILESQKELQKSQIVFDESAQNSLPSFEMQHTVKEVLDQLHSRKFFSTIDLKNGFFDMEMDDRKKFTSFVTHDGQYELNKVPFDLCNSPSIFQSSINHVFRDLLKEGIVIIYMDDIVIPSIDELDGLKRLSRVQRFLGITGYFRKFIQNYALVAKPLSDLRRENTEFYFGPEQKSAFETLKQKLSGNPVLHIFKQGAKLELHTDASKFGYGAILFQQSDDNKFYPIHYMSKKTFPQEEEYSSYELEVLAIIEALKKS
ncbi:hypothetical protein AVEN_110144-1 [Araneus ventricosus]|uniref:RNA-directed DNA polymerase n=1 Tax=Araneus ventricosus TaxID=182803 RepID=A0A4Y2J279_ARAVE|nr:hypothetical protein AVEN_110144-1 [Araneus ventricosus]